ncbi:MAG: hypothetical protein U0W24_04270 [Bacteroidales bacterium]
MKTTNNSILVIFVLIIAFSVACSNNQKPGTGKFDLNGIKPPEVKQPTLDLKLPEVLKQEDTVPPMTKDTTSFIYRILLNDKIPPDKFSLSGTLVAVEKGNLLVKTAQGQLQMQYFIPKNESLLIEKGGQITITTNNEIKDASFNKLLHLEASKGVILSSGRITDNSPIQIIINKNLSLQQSSYNKKMIISNSEYDTHYSTTLFLVNNGNKKSMEQKKEFVFENNNQKYKLMIQLSSFSIPKPEYQSSSEGQGYYLEYLLYMIK